MKKIWRLVLLAAATVALLCITAYAENENVVVKDTSGNLSNVAYYKEYSEATNSGTLSTTYNDTVAFGMTYTDDNSVANGTMAILIISTADTEKSETLNANNIQYINLYTFQDSKFSAVLYPATVGASYVYISYSGLSGLTKIAEIDTAFLLGDANHDGKLGLKDAIQILKYVASTKNTVDTIAGDVDKDSKCGLKDAILILKFVAGKIKSFN